MKYAPNIPKRSSAALLASLFTIGLLGFAGMSAYATEVWFAEASTKQYVNEDFGLSFTYPRYLQLSHNDEDNLPREDQTLRVGDYYWNIADDDWKNHDNLTYRSRLVRGLTVELEDWRNTRYFTEVDLENERTLLDEQEDTNQILDIPRGPRAFRYSKEKEISNLIDNVNRYLNDDLWGGNNFERSEIDLWGRKAVSVKYDTGDQTTTTNRTILLYDEDFTLKIRLSYMADNDEAQAQVDTFLKSLTWDKL